jgi:hypothetical protein
VNWRPRPARSRGALIGLALMTVLGTSACGPAITVDPSGSIVDASTAVSPLTEPSPVASASAPQSLRIVWSEQAFDGEIASVIADRGQFVAVGSDPTSRAAWTSRDGLTWTRHAVPNPAPDDCAEFYDPICFPNSAPMGQLVRLQDTLYSIGTTFSFNDYLRPVGWRLTDGQTWAAIHSESPFYGYGQVTDLTAGDAALVATKFGAAGFASEVWRWTLETSWVATELAGSSETPLEVFDTAWGANTYVAIGMTAEPIDDVAFYEWPRSPTIWTSADGLTWTSTEPFPPTASLCAATATTDGFIVLGTTDVGPAIWITGDLTTWVQLDLPSSTDGAADPYSLFQMCSVTQLDRGLLATQGTAEGTLTWLSTDGNEWQAGPTLDFYAGPHRIAALGNTVVLAGYRRGASPDDAAPVLFVGSVEP